MIGLMALIFVLAIISLLSSPSQTEQPTLSPSPSSEVTNNLPESFLFPDPSPEKVYSPEVLEEDFKRLNSPTPLDQSDAQIRNRLISTLEGQSGFLQQASDYNIKYIKTRNIFMIEILSTNSDQAKVAALDWFKSQGLSTQGTCNLPVSIYLNSTVKEQLKSQNQTFNPIPEGCQL